jgi:hypothetical protein
MALFGRHGRLDLDPGDAFWGVPCGDVRGVHSPHEAIPEEVREAAVREGDNEERKKKGGRREEEGGGMRQKGGGGREERRDASTHYPTQQRTDNNQP